MNWTALIFQALRLLPKNHLSRLAGRLAAAPLPAPLLQPLLRLFCRIYRVDMDAVRQPLRSFRTFEDFFTRELKEGARPVDARPESVVAPCDGAWGMAGTVRDGLCVQVKGSDYSLASLLGESELAAALEGGTFATFYLAPRDYHRFHCPCAAEVERSRYVPGALWPVGSIGLRFVDGLFAVNERIVTVLRPTGGSAPLAFVAVGATVVGSVRVVFDDLATNRANRRGRESIYPEPRPRLAKGEELGRFELGSTIVLVAGPGSIDLEIAPPGTPLLTGTKIGSLRPGQGPETRDQGP